MPYPLAEDCWGACIGGGLVAVAQGPCYLCWGQVGEAHVLSVLVAKEKQQP